MLSSDSESCPDNSFIKEDYSHHEELSELTQFQGRGKDENAGRKFTDGKTKSRKLSNKKSPKKQVESQVCTSTKEKTINYDTNKGLILEGERVVQ